MRFILGIATTCFIGVIASGQESPKAIDNKNVQTLIQQLGNPRFADRERAQKALIELGPDIAPAIQEGTRSTDPEVQSRCKKIAELLKVPIMKRKCAEYLADEKGERAHPLPFREQFEKRFGRSREARKLFAACLVGNDALLQSLEQTNDQAEALKLLQDRCANLYKSLQASDYKIPAKGDDLLSLMFASLILNEPNVELKKSNSISFLFLNPTWKSILLEHENRKSHQKLVMNWIDSRPSTDVISHEFFIVMVDQFKLHFAEDYLTKIITNSEASPVQHRVPAIHAFVGLKQREAIPTLKKWLDQKEVICDFGDNSQSRLSDLALAKWIELEKKSLTDYSIGQLQAAINSPYKKLTTYPLYFFVNDEKRKIAREKWLQEITKAKGK